MQYTIESRSLTSDTTPSKQMQIEAANPESAISEFVRQSNGELVSVTKPLTGRESIATVKKNDAVFLVRVYSD